MCALSFTKVSLMNVAALHLEHRYSELRVTFDEYEVPLLAFSVKVGLEVNFIRY